MSGHPDAWAADKAAKMRRYATDLRTITTRARDVCLPGAPVAALLGFFANGSRNENTTGWKSCSARERADALARGQKPLGGSPTSGYGSVTSTDLHELGPGGVEAGHVPDEVATGTCAWVTGARSADVRTILGRPGVEGSAWHGAIEDQVAIGVWNLARHRAQIRAKLPSTLQWDPVVPVTLWQYVVARMSWSAGTGGAARHLARYATQLAAVPEFRRVAVLYRLAAQFDGPGRKHARPSYTVLRAAQMVAAARVAAGELAECEATGWLDEGLGADRAAVLEELVRSALDD